MNSAYAQAGVESAFYVRDVVEKGIEGGPIAAVGEAGKKLAESVILGPPSFYEPSMAPEVLTGDGGPFADIRRNVESALKYSAKRGFKTGVTGYSSSLVVKKFIETRSKWTYLKSIDQAIEGSMESGYRIVGQSQAEKAVEAFQAMTEARAKFQKALQEGAFPRYADIAGNSLKESLKKAAKDPKMRKLAASVGRDLAKEELKEVVGDWIEGTALRSYLAAETEARLATQIFLAASGVYWESYDLYQARVADRREILRQYEPKNHMQIKKDERFPEGAELLIVLRDLEGHPLPATGHKITVKLGGKPARLGTQDQFFFAVKAEDLQHDGKGGVALEISVEQ
jgi:ribosome modulation factor